MGSGSVSVTLPVVDGHPSASITGGGEQATLFAQGASTPNAVVSIHDNQHPSYCGLDPTATGHGGGYGVSVNVGGFPKIEHNVFDSNRHAIAANGHAGDGYTLIGNLFLNPGIDDVKLGVTNFNHQIDVHGKDTCPDVQRRQPRRALRRDQQRSDPLDQAAPGSHPDRPRKRLLDRAWSAVRHCDAGWFRVDRGERSRSPNPPTSSYSFLTTAPPPPLHYRSSPLTAKACR
jgi:hypothetical protein